ncbi:D-alanyl-D-alanine carboxypeptidase [Paracoccus suum]|uniref:D-alanyl-D-alanine carboxypeptidase n=1 Tax=Paracoccus suum TaxID=2259340 RepID=A0A344PKV1_9RHOB|nr:D-alanyl-D-alanine carboxypeptidase family protein [Paracoccus suum]AXC50006.1 D-alanyl-D-alanine carboxypeptidase [Paracoccus suum]
MIAVALTAATTAQQAGAAPFAAYVMDGRTGKTLHSQNGDTPLHPASLTKMMTLYLAFAAIEQGRVRLDSRFTVSQHAASMPPSKLGLRPGQQIELRYLIRAAAVKSANDAATVIGEGLAGSEPAFAQQMTATARALGMRNTQFRNANGLSADGHYSSAHDLTILGRHLFYDFPQYYSIFSRRSADAGVGTVNSTNARFLDNYQGADGIKTGYTRAAGFNLTASAQRGQQRVMATVMGGTSTAQRNQIMAQLLDAGFSRSPARVAVVKPATVVVQPQRVRRATVPQAQAVAAVPRTVTVRPAANVASIATSVAPVRRTQSVAAAAPSPGGIDLSEALREAMATRPEPSPERPVPARTRAPAPVAEGDDSGSAVASLRPPTKPEGSSPDSDLSPDSAAAAPPAKSSAEPALAPARPARRDSAASLDGGTVKLASLESGDRPAAGKAASTNWGITLGRYRSKAEAEQMLLKTALREADALGEGLRKVGESKRGYEARFVNLSRAQAQLACDKLQARSQKCTVNAP